VSQKINRRSNDQGKDKGDYKIKSSNSPNRCTRDPRHDPNDLKNYRRLVRSGLSHGKILAKERAFWSQPIRIVVREGDPDKDGRNGPVVL
jgi:hypothetical protein